MLRCFDNGRHLHWPPGSLNTRTSAPSHEAVASDAQIASELATMDWEGVAVQQQ